jgi:hypothetical protein
VFSSPLKNINGCILLLYGCISLRNWSLRCWYSAQCLFS